ncbi:MAG: hypothetical protein N0A03_05315 [Anaerolineae bacterium]|nr:hypothetical protein [Anaerolineae bacterium]
MPSEGLSVPVPPVMAEATSAPSPPPPAVVPPLILEETEIPAPSEAEIPDWLREAEKEPAAPPIEAGGLVPAEIPEWLRALQPRAEMPAEVEPVETEGFLAGLRGLLPVARGLDKVSTAGPSLPVAPSPAAVARAELLQSLLSRPLVLPHAEAREAVRREGWMLTRLLVGLVLLVAIVAPMLVQWRLFGPPLIPTADNLFALVEGIAPQTPVLVAWEYGPAEAEEMDRVAGPLMDHLLRRQARLVIVSTRMEGPATAEALLTSRLADTQERLRRVANLGYIPGQATGVREAIGNLDGRTEWGSGAPAEQIEAMAGVQSVADVGMVVILAAQPEDLRVWVEQVSATRPDVPIVAGISARAEPLMGPYLAAGQIQGALSGLTGGAAYEQRLDTGRGREYEYYLNSLGLALWAVAALTVLGALISLLGGRKR